MSPGPLQRFFNIYPGDKIVLLVNYTDGTMERKGTVLRVVEVNKERYQGGFDFYTEATVNSGNWGFLYENRGVAWQKL